MLIFDRNRKTASKAQPVSNEPPFPANIVAKPATDVIQRDYRHLLWTTAGGTELEAPVEVLVRTHLERTAGDYVLGDLVYTLSLFPGEQVQMFSSDRRTRFSIDTTTNIGFHTAATFEDQMYLSSMDSFFGQVNAFVLASAVVFVRLAPVSAVEAGFVLALGTWLKIYPALISAIGIWDRRTWRAIGWSVAAALAIAASCAAYASAPEAAQAPGSERQCFFLSQVDGYHHVKGARDRIRVSTGPRDTYEFEVFGPCPYLDDAEIMGFDQAGGGTICSGLDVDLIVPTPNGLPQRCPVRMIRKLAPDEKR